MQVEGKEVKADFQFGEQKTTDHAPDRNSEAGKSCYREDGKIRVPCVVWEGNRYPDRNIPRVIENMGSELSVKMEIDIIHLRFKCTEGDSVTLYSSELQARYRTLYRTSYRALYNSMVALFGISHAYEMMEK